MAATSRAITNGMRLRRPRAVGMLAAAVVLVATTYVSAALQPRASTSSRATLVGDAATVTAPLGAAVGNASSSVEQIDRAIEVWSANIAAEPADFLSATNLAMLYHGRGQLTGSLDNHERALAAVRTALATAPTHAPARALEAAIRLTLHDFAGALAAAEALYQDDPTQLGALATRADAELELGLIAEARLDLAVLAAQAAGPAIDVRLARLAFLSGNPTEAIRLARSARDAARAEAAASGGIDAGFYEFVAGEYARLAGDAAAARVGYEAALAIRPTDLGAMVGLARIDAYDGRLQSAVEGLQSAAAIAPQPETLALLGDLLRATDDISGADAAHDTVRFIERLDSLQGVVYDRQLLRFGLDHAGSATAIHEAARASLAARSDPAGHDLVAWALYRLGRFDEAALEITAARADGADDARLRFHDGAIAVARGDRGAGLALLESALALGPALDPIERAEAQRLIGP